MEGGTKEKEKEDEVWQAEQELMNAVLAADPVNSAISGDWLER